MTFYLISLFTMTTKYGFVEMHYISTGFLLHNTGVPKLVTPQTPLKMQTHI
jgi:hypothetical protein